MLVSDKKHAYLILAHQDFEILEALIRTIDDSRNDIFIHFDAKIKDIPTILTQNARINYLKNRASVEWGDSSMLEAEYLLFEYARKVGNYGYYHLLSGVDMPVKKQDEIHDFFNNNQGKQFVGFIQVDRMSEIRKRIGTYHFFSHFFRNDKSVQYWVLKIIRFALNKTQNLLGINRNKEIDFKMGPQWVSITEEFVDYILINKKYFNKIFKNTYCSDELFMQTAIFASPFKGDIYSTEKEFEGCARIIHWVDGNLINWKLEDIEFLLKSNACFARKFDKKNMNAVVELSSRLLRDN